MMTTESCQPSSGAQWLRERIGALTTHVDSMSPSEWAERNRYLPPSNTSLPGRYRFEVAPYLREIIDCMDVDSPIRDCAVMKGAQVCCTVGLLENTVGYVMAHVKNAPCLVYTADADTAKLRLETNIIPMIQESGLASLITSSDTLSKGKSGKTDKKIEWLGGGYMIPLGANNPGKMRTFSGQFLLRDEIDGWKLVVGKDGDPMKLTYSRTNGFETTRKVLDLSTPLLKGTSQIAKRFKLGDQRYYFVCCLKCNFPQVLRWSRTSDQGEVSAVVWEPDVHGNLIPDSVRYLCEKCQHPHFNHDKVRMLLPSNGAEWRPTAAPSSPDFRSYHIGALYSPVGMQTWDGCVRMWLDAWDVGNSRVKDHGALQVFYNNVLGKPYGQTGQKRVRMEDVSPHRRSGIYNSGQIPNHFAIEHAGSPVLFVCCTVDVQAEYLAVAVWGWCRDRRVFCISYQRFVGSTERLENVETWGRLSELVETAEYVADDGKRYRIQTTLIDSGYRQDVVHDFCAQYAGGVWPIKGLPVQARTAKTEFFAEMKTRPGQLAFGIYVDHYKDRWSAALRRSWSGLGQQPEGFFNAPGDIDDKQLRELTVETKKAIIDAATKQVESYVWDRPSGSRNEFWDLLIYANAAFDIIAYLVCIKQYEQETVNWFQFYESLAGGLFFTED